MWFSVMVPKCGASLCGSSSELCMRRLVVLLISLQMIFLSGAAMAAGEEIVVDRIMARVDDTIITRSDLVRAFPIYLQIAARIDPAEMRNIEGQARVAKGLLEYLIDAKLIMARAEKEDMAMSKADVDAYLANYRDSLNMSASQFRQALAAEGVDYDDYTEFMRSHLTRLQVMRSEAVADITVLDEEVEAALLEQYPDGFEQPYFETSHILIQLPKSATNAMVEEAFEKLTAIRAQIATGEVDFEDVAEELNPDGTRYRGGLVGTFTLGELDADYTRAALGLERGEVSAPVRTQFGIHLIRLESIERREVADLDEVRARIRYDLREQKGARQEELYLRRLREAAFVQVVSGDFGL